MSWASTCSNTRCGASLIASDILRPSSTDARHGNRPAGTSVISRDAMHACRRRGMPHHGLLAAAACDGNRWVTQSQGRPLVHAQLCLQVSVEAALEITYQPQAVFRVRPVSRCTASMPGEHMCSKNTCQNLQLSA